MPQGVPQASSAVVSGTGVDFRGQDERRTRITRDKLQSHPFGKPNCVNESIASTRALPMCRREELESAERVHHFQELLIILFRDERSAHGKPLYISHYAKEGGMAQTRRRLFGRSS